MALAQLYSLMSTNNIQSFTIHQYIANGSSSQDDQAVINLARQFIHRITSPNGWIDCNLPPSNDYVSPDVHGLEEFDHVDLSCIWAKHSPEPELDSSQLSSSDRPKKRRKLHTESLQGTIPQVFDVSITRCNTN